MSGFLRLCLLAPAILLTGCRPFTPDTTAHLDLSGSGPGNVGGTWTDHITIPHSPWRFQFTIDCRDAGHGWEYDLTLEQMYSNNYFDAVPLTIGTGQRDGSPPRQVYLQRLARSGEFFFIVRSSAGCHWRIVAPVLPSGRAASALG